MSQTTPSTQELATNITAQLEAALSQSIPLLPKAFLRVLAKVLAAGMVLLYRYGNFLLLQQYTAYATIEETEVNGKKIRPLIELGRQLGVRDPLAPSRAELVVSVTVENQTGTLPAESQLLRSETGVIYLTAAPRALDAATVDVTIVASSDQNGGDGGGVIGNLSPGDTLEFANPLPNVAREVTVVSTTVLGVGGETKDEYRAFVQKRERGKPQGGAYADYRVWGEAVPGVANIYPYRGLPGQIDVHVEAKRELQADGLADAALLAAVLAAINLDVDGLASNRPVSDAVNMLSITRNEFGVTVGGLFAPNLGATQSAISRGVDEYLRSCEPFIVGLSVLPRKDSITQGAIAGKVNAIANANGGTVANVVLMRGGFPVNAWTLRAGEKAKLAAAGITYE